MAIKKTTFHNTTIVLQFINFCIAILIIYLIFIINFFIDDTIQLYIHYVNANSIFLLNILSIQDIKFYYLKKGRYIFNIIIFNIILIIIKKMTVIFEYLMYNFINEDPFIFKNNFFKDNCYNLYR